MSTSQKCDMIIIAVQQNKQHKKSTKKEDFIRKNESYRTFEKWFKENLTSLRNPFDKQ